MSSLGFYLASEVRFKNSFNTLLLSLTNNAENGMTFHTACVVLLSALEVAIQFHHNILRCGGDIFIITVSAVLATRFRQIVERVSFLIEKKVRIMSRYKVGNNVKRITLSGSK